MERKGHQRSVQGAVLHARLPQSRDEYPTQGNGRAALHYTAGYGNVEATLQLLDAGADVDVTDKAGMTPLHFAAQMGQRDTTELLLQRRANPFLIVMRGIHKGRLAIDLSSGRSTDLKKRLTDAMSNMCDSAALALPRRLSSAAL